MVTYRGERVVGARNLRVVVRLALLCCGQECTPGLAVDASGTSLRTREHDILHEAAEWICIHIAAELVRIAAISHT